MRVADIRAKAKEMKIPKYYRLSKKELIHAIQRAEGNVDCFEAIDNCGQSDCAWMEDCQPR